MVLTHVKTKTVNSSRIIPLNKRHVSCLPGDPLQTFPQLWVVICRNVSGEKFKRKLHLQCKTCENDFSLKLFSDFNSRRENNAGEKRGLSSFFHLQSDDVSRAGRRDAKAWHGLASRQKGKMAKKEGRKMANSMIGPQVLHDKRWMHVGGRKSHDKRRW